MCAERTITIELGKCTNLVSIVKTNSVFLICFFFVISNQAGETPLLPLLVLSLGRHRWENQAKQSARMESMRLNSLPC